MRRKLKVGDCVEPNVAHHGFMGVRWPAKIVDIKNGFAVVRQDAQRGDEPYSPYPVSVPLGNLSRARCRLRKSK